MGNDTIFNRAELPAANYNVDSLVEALSTAINSASWFGDNQYSVAYNENRNTLTISRPDDGVRSFFIPDDSLLELPAFQDQTNPRTAGFVAYEVNWRSPQSALGLLGLGKRSSAGTSLTQFMTLIAGTHLKLSQESGSADTRKLHNVYVRSNALSSSSIIGPPQSQTLLCKIPVTNMLGDVLVKYHSGGAHDYINCSGRTLSVLDFYITDYAGNSISLHGGALSLELLFCAPPI